MTIPANENAEGGTKEGLRSSEKDPYVAWAMVSAAMYINNVFTAAGSAAFDPQSSNLDLATSRCPAEVFGRGRPPRFAGQAVSRQVYKACMHIYY